MHVCISGTFDPDADTLHYNKIRHTFKVFLYTFKVFLPYLRVQLIEVTAKLISKLLLVSYHIYIFSSSHGCRLQEAFF